jgi:hypothetical protein
MRITSLLSLLLAWSAAGWALLPTLVPKLSETMNEPVVRLIEPLPYYLSFAYLLLSLILLWLPRFKSTSKK